MPFCSWYRPGAFTRQLIPSEATHGRISWSRRTPLALNHLLLPKNSEKFVYGGGRRPHRCDICAASFEHYRPLQLYVTKWLGLKSSMLTQKTIRILQQCLRVRHLHLSGYSSSDFPKILASVEQPLQSLAIKHVGPLFPWLQDSILAGWPSTRNLRLIAAQLTLYEELRDVCRSTRHRIQLVEYSLYRYSTPITWYYSRVHVQTSRMHSAVDGLSARHSSLLDVLNIHAIPILFDVPNDSHIEGVRLSDYHTRAT
ncbi:hypothetical protein BKA62DRAFT_513586 [Auriculariales sp. MPI-PUGE-AT-0066]|nr:hypothetical protein BKA62DRAFT_513586 [Auriculariales sp. MPI-PUGE-AT-0066]